MPQPCKHLSTASFVLAAILSLCISPASAQTPPAQTPPARTLSVDGNAETHIVPDTALVTTGVATDGETAAAALTANSTILAKVVEAIRSFGIEAKDLQTIGLSVAPRYYRPEKPTATDRPRIIGYTAANEVTARVHDLGKLGDLLDKVTLAGANRIDGIAFVVSNQEGLLDEARRKAVADAKSKAELYARAAGFTLGKVMSLTEDNLPLFRPLERARMASGAAAPAAVAVPIEAGEATLSVRVHVVWSLAD
ncbi:MAG TPA: SIMPL domain-containing protein [Xanthobacteraceae bacterium]